MEQGFTSHLGWDPPLQRVHEGSSRLVTGIDVLIDFQWKAVIGHRERIFTNYKSLANYILKKTSNGRPPVLLLTNQTGKPEGCLTDHPTHDIFIVNILSYKTIENNDAAGAYFAGLKGVPIINPDLLDEPSKYGLLEKIGSAALIGNGSTGIRGIPYRFVPSWAASL
jgi:hypothetical protein